MGTTSNTVERRDSVELTARTIPLTAIPSFLKGVEIDGDGSMLSACNDFLTDELRKAEIKSELTTQIPNLKTSNRVRDIYQKQDFAKIKQLEKVAQDAIQPIVDNIKTNRYGAWTKVKYGDDLFLMSWSEHGCMWVRRTDVITSENGTSFHNVIEQGTYTDEGQILGVSNYNLTTNVLLPDVIISAIIAFALGDVVVEGLSFITAAFSLLMVNAASALGLEGFSCAIAATTLSTLSFALVFVVVFIGLIVLYNILHVRYTVRLQVFNWDDKNDWKIADSYHDNAVIAGTDKDYTDPVTIPKFDNHPDLPPFIKPVEVLDNVCSYATIVYENDNKFMEGCCMALQFKKADLKQGFMWAFACQFWRDNKQAARDGIMDPKEYYDNANWNDNPLSFHIEATDSKIPISFKLDKLTGGDKNVYNATININHLD